MYFWDFLRPLIDFANIIDPFVRFIVFIFAFILMFIALLAYKKNTENKRMLLLAFAFGLFALEGLLKIIDIFFSPGTFLAGPTENLIDVLILALLFFAVLRKK